MKKYSVLMSVYKADNPVWLKESLDSMLNQTFKPDEFVVVKDGKLTSELEAVLKQYSSQNHGLFHFVELVQNQGLGIALMHGIKSCKNEYIARMDADDISLEKRCEIQMNYLEQHPECDIVGSLVKEFEGNIEHSISSVCLPETNQEIYQFAKRRNPFRHPAVVFKKSKVLEVGNYRNYLFCEDYDLFVRLILNGCQMYNIQQELVYMRVNRDFYARRGGYKYLKSIMALRKEMWKSGFTGLKDYICIGCISSVVYLLPNTWRDFVYRKFLRK